LANAVWVQSGYSLIDGYRDLLRELCDVEDARVDFRGDPIRASRTINNWTGAKTGGRISSVVGPDDFSEWSKLVLSSALYFRASWRNPFLKESTRDGSFRVGPNRSVTIPMMHEHSYAEDFGYAENDAWQMLRIACAADEFSMIVLLPKRWNGLNNVEESLAPQTLESWIKMLRVPEEIDVELPKFTIAARMSIKNVLSRLGMPGAFTDSADFSGINGKANDLCLSDAIHATFIDVNETGIEAAAALGYISPDSFGGEPPSFHADHPFLFLVRDNRSGCILFLGRVVDPTPSSERHGS
jgi:serpin B